MKVEKTQDNYENILDSVKAILNKEILVGVPESNAARQSGYMTNAEIGYINEYGSPAHNIPARPHLIPGIESARERITNLMGQALKTAMDQKDGESKLEQAGIVAQTAVKNTITNGAGFAPLAPATLAARRASGRSSDKPLVDTSEYRDSITYVVEDKDASS